MLAKPSPWYPGINREHPLGRDVLAAYPMWNTGYELQDVSGNNLHLPFLDGAALTWGGSPYGTAWIGAGAGSDCFEKDFGRDIDDGVDFTYLIVQQSTAAGVADTMLAVTGAGGAQEISRMEYRTADDLRQFGDYARINVTSGNVSRGDWVVVMVRWSGTTLSDMWLNGFGPLGLDTSFTAADPVRRLTIGGRFTGLVPHVGGIAGVIFWSRYLPDVEMQMASADPFALFREPDLTALWGSVTGVPAASGVARLIFLTGEIE